MMSTATAKPEIVRGLEGAPDFLQTGDGFPPMLIRNDQRFLFMQPEKILAEPDPGQTSLPTTVNRLAVNCFRQDRGDLADAIPEAILTWEQNGLVVGLYDKPTNTLPIHYNGDKSHRDGVILGFEEKGWLVGMQTHTANPHPRGVPPTALSCLRVLEPHAATLPPVFEFCTITITPDLSCRYHENDIVRLSRPDLLARVSVKTLNIGQFHFIDAYPNAENPRALDVLYSYDNGTPKTITLTIEELAA